MRKISILITVLIFTFNVHGQNQTINKKPTNQNAIIKISDTLTVRIANEVTMPTIPDRLTIENLNKSDWKDQMPWVVALLIGLSSVAITILLGRRQISSSERIFSKQIETSKEIASLDFKKVVISGNRQEWINGLRDNLSNYLAKSESYSIALLNPTNTADKLQSLINERLSEILALEAKIVLMLNSNEEDSKELIKFLGIYTKCIFGEAITQPVEVLKQKIMEIAKKILKAEWERVKKGE